MALLLADADPAPTARGRKSAITAAVRGVADWLGDTPTVARSSYIDPRIISRYDEDGGLATIPRLPAVLPADAGGRGRRRRAAGVRGGRPGRGPGRRLKIKINIMSFPNGRVASRLPLGRPAGQVAGGPEGRVEELHEVGVGIARLPDLGVGQHELA